MHYRIELESIDLFKFDFMYQAFDFFKIFLVRYEI